jgi:hypothetical protein
LQVRVLPAADRWLFRRSDGVASACLITADAGVLKWRNRMISRIANFRLPATTLHLWRTAAAAELARLPPSLDAAVVIVSRVCGQQKQRWHA